ncbi:MAG: serine hydrolase [Chitinophagales bacterium]|nr:serine hydrolase [Chitinophagales bacterium]
MDRRLIGFRGFFTAKAQGRQGAPELSATLRLRALLVKASALLCVLLFSAVNLFSQKKDHRLEQKILPLLQGYQGDIGIYIKNLRTGKTVSYQADTIFPTASIVKIPIMIGILDKMEKKELDYHQEFIYHDSMLYAGVDILGSFKSGEKIELSKLLMLMLTTSDNTASLWLQAIAGTGTRINEIMDSLGFQHTRVNSRTPGREENRNQYGWGQTTPREIATMIERIYRMNIVSKGFCERALRLLGRNYWDAEALSQIPPTVEVFSKNGAVNASRSEVFLVNAPRNPYLVAIFTKNNKDQSWNQDNEAWKLTKEISKLLWAYFSK